MYYVQVIKKIKETNFWKVLKVALKESFIQKTT